MKKEIAEYFRSMPPDVEEEISRIGMDPAFRQQVFLTRRGVPYEVTKSLSEAERVAMVIAFIEFAPVIGISKKMMRRLLARS